MKSLNISSKQELDDLMRCISDEVIDENLMFTKSDLDKLCEDIDFNEQLTLSPVQTENVETVVEPDWNNFSEGDNVETVVEPDWNNVSIGDELNISNIIQGNDVFLDDVELNLDNILNSQNDIHIPLPASMFDDEIQQWLQQSSNMSNEEMDGYISTFLNSNVAEEIEQVKEFQIQYVVGYSNTICHV